MFQFFTYLTLQGRVTYARFKSYIPLLSIAALTWSALFYGVGYPFWKMLLITSAGILSAPLVWQAFSVYKVKLKSQEGLEKWNTKIANMIKPVSLRKVISSPKKSPLTGLL